MTIYTRTGDKGTTSLFGGKRVLKSDVRIEACGLVDELSGFIGLTITKLGSNPEIKLLTAVQYDLHRMMAYLSGSKIDLVSLTKKVKVFEQIIDREQLRLPRLTRFILPQGTEISCWFHILRSVCRRSEHLVVKYQNKSEIVRYLNRLSDLFYILARKYNHHKEILI